MTITVIEAASVSRRGSLRALGGAAIVAALTTPLAASAKSSGEKTGKRCRRQRDQCRTVFAGLCEGFPSCEAAYAPCCEHFSRCDAGKGISCIFLVD